MSFMRVVKKAFWSVFAAGVSILAWFINAFQMVRNVFLLILDLPGKALTAAAVFIGVIYGIACFYMGGGILNIIGNIAGGCVVLFLAYKIFNFVCMIGCALIGIVFGFLDFDRMTNFFTELLYRAIHRYMNLFDANGPTRKDRMLFGVPWIIHKINWLFNKMSSIISFAMYILWGIAGFYFSYQWLFTNVSDFATQDYIIGFAVVIVITGIFIWFGHCVAQAIRMATEFAKPLDELFGVYAEFFQNTECEDSNSYTNSTDTGYSRNSYEHEQDNHRTQYTDYEDNPYYQVLSAAESADELKKLYRDFAKKLHPDVCNEYSVEESTNRMAQLNSIYKKLKKQF